MFENSCLKLAENLKKKQATFSKERLKVYNKLVLNKR
jgi:hypothetical protein